MPDLFGANNKHVFICNKYLGNKSVEEIENQWRCIYFFMKKHHQKIEQLNSFFNSKERAFFRVL